MIRRWSYIEANSTLLVIKDLSFTNTHFKKTFKHTVRFKKFSKNFSKLTRKKYAFRKINNSNYNFLTCIYSWVKSYSKFVFVEKYIHTSNLYSLDSNSAVNFKQHWNNSIALSKASNYKFVSSRLSSNFYPISLKFYNDFLYLDKNYQAKAFITLDHSLLTNNSLYLLKFNKLLRKLFILCVLTKTFVK